MKIFELLKESLFSRILTRAARWTLLKNGANLETSVRLYWRKARFYLDSNHEFVIEMASLKYARIKVFKHHNHLNSFDIFYEYNFLRFK